MCRSSMGRRIGIVKFHPRSRLGRRVSRSPDAVGQEQNQRCDERSPVDSRPMRSSPAFRLAAPAQSALVASQAIESMELVSR
jgi:hypothetical protein